MDSPATDHATELVKRLLLLALLVACGGEPKPPPLPVSPPIRAALVPQGRFTVGQGVKTIQAVWIRSTPYHGNTKINVIATAPAGTPGTILDGPVIDTSSDGDRWGRWQVALTAFPTGWVADTYLVATTVPPPPPAPVVTTVSVSPASLSLLVGATGQLLATAHDQNGAIMAEQSFTWTSGSGPIAVVSSTGLVTGIAPGGATITAADAGKIGQAGVTVTAPPPPPPPTVAGIMVLPSAASIRLGDVFLFRDTVFDTNGAVMVKSVAWSSGNTAVAAVDTMGSVTTMGLGSTLITATIGTIHASGQLTVMPRRALPFNGVYAEVQLRNGRIRITREDAQYLFVVIHDTVADSLGTFSGAGFLVRTTTAPGYAAALRQLASDLPNITDMLHVETANPLGIASLACLPTGCFVIAQTPGHALWTSAPPLGAASLIGLAHALEAAARGDSVFAPADSLPYVRSLP